MQLNLIINDNQKNIFQTPNTSIPPTEEPSKVHPIDDPPINPAVPPLEPPIPDPEKPNKPKKYI